MDIKEFENVFREYLDEMNIVLNDKQIEQFYEYMNLLLNWNEKINLTAIIEPKEIILKHFIDSLTINKYIEKNKNLVDIGTGAGFPGIPLKILRPDLKITLLDSLNKRINFLNEVIKILKLENIDAVHSRIEEFGKNKKYRENFDYVTSRAVANLTVLSEYMIPLSTIGGSCICMKAGNIEEEKNESLKAIEILGGRIEKIQEFNLPKSDIKRNIILINKLKSTSPKYPRKPGMPAKDPIK